MRSVVGALLLVGMLALTGCVDADPLPTVPPTPTSTPIFASEEEALAAAETAYAAYNEMSGLIASEGGTGPDRITDLVTEERLSDELRGFETLREADLRLVGNTTVEVLELQRYEEFDGNAEVVFYACWDASESRVVDAAGQDVTPAGRRDRLVLEVVLTTVNGTLPLRLRSDEEWPESTC